ncbi:MAG: CPBP family intramembrane metalloprotease [Lachnospiraceae bacterium]|nr:CPBP family intramembrane metalloprotease [Lachnospiraceae bacterium]
MDKKYSTWHTIKYIMLAILPIFLFKGIATVTMSVVQVIIGAKFYAQGGTPEGLMAHLVEVLNSDVAIKLTTLMQIISLVAGLIILFAIMKRNDFGSPIKAFPRLTFPGTIILMIGGAFITLFVMPIFAIIAPGLMEGYTELISSSGLAGFTLVSILATLVIAPLNEEVLFRGISFALLKKANLKFWLVNIIQALCFGITHLQFQAGFQGGIKYLNIVQGTYAFVLGLFLGYVRERTGSLWGSILGHMIFNFVGTFVVSWMTGLGETVQVAIMIGCGIVFTIIGFILMEKKRGVPADE